MATGVGQSFNDTTHSETYSTPIDRGAEINERISNKLDTLKAVHEVQIERLNLIGHSALLIEEYALKKLTMKELSPYVTRFETLKRVLKNSDAEYEKNSEVSVLVFANNAYKSEFALIQKELSSKIK